MLLYSSIKELDYSKLQKDILSYLPQLRGGFAFVLDNKDSYILARDPLGLEPLYYTINSNQLYFSDDILELFEISKRVKEPNIDSMKSLLECQAVGFEDTMFKGIYRVPAGSILYISKRDKKKHIERFWFPEKIEIDYKITPKEASAKIRELLLKSINRCVKDKRECAFELSGGLDSSSIVSLYAKSYGKEGIDTYSMSFGNLSCDESRYIKSVVDKYLLNHKYIPANSLDYKDRYSLKNLYTLSPDWPIIYSFAISLPMIEQIVKDGKRVIVTGQGGDHLFTGAPEMLSDLIRRGEFLELLKELRYYNRPLKGLLSYGVKPLINPKALRVINRLRGVKDNNLCSHLELEFLNRIKSVAKRLDLASITTAHHTTNLDSNLFHCIKRAYNIEFCHPFFDLDLVEFVLSLPSSMNFKEANIKWILREAMRGILPEIVRTRDDKAEFSPIFKEQFRDIDIDEVFKNSHIVKLGIIAQDELNGYINSYKSRGDLPLELDIALNLEYWYRFNGFGE